MSLKLSSVLFVSALTSAAAATFSAKSLLIRRSATGFLERASGAWLRVPFTHVSDRLYAMILDFKHWSRGFQFCPNDSC